MNQRHRDYLNILDRASRLELKAKRLRAEANIKPVGSAALIARARLMQFSAEHIRATVEELRT